MSSVFISHSSASAAAAGRIERAFKAAGYEAWLDNSDLGVGVQLRPELHEAIRNSRSVVLVWSEPASRSRWVSTEVLTAFHLDRFIVPCVTDAAPLPQFLGGPAYIDMRTAGDEALARLVTSAATAPAAANPIAPHVGAPTAELLRESDRLAQLQMSVTDPLNQRELAAAAGGQRALDPHMAEAERRWPYELAILTLGGYHRKNAYMVKHWDQIQAGRPPQDPLLLEAERRFFEAALVNPNDVSAINGLASILIFELELDTATFFNDRALALSQKAGITYDAAEQDRAMIAWMREQAAAGI